MSWLQKPLDRVERLLFPASVFVVLIVVGSSFVSSDLLKSGELVEGRRPSFARTTIILEKKNGGTVSFDVEKAVTPDELMYGLMFKKEMGAREGMVFVLDPPRTASFWMKNTYIPLDMLFIKPGGIVGKIVQAKPLDLTLISSDGPVSFVVELNAGAAALDGIDVGDRLVVN